MIKVAYSQSFIKAYKKKIIQNTAIIANFFDRFQIFIHNPFDKSLKTHKLSGKLKDLWAFSLEYDLRIVFYFENNHQNAVFIDIGSHDEVY